MDFNATIDLIIRELDEAREIIDDLKKYAGAPLLQIELAKSKCRNASEVIAMLKEIRETRQDQKEPVKEPEKPEKHTRPEAPVSEQEKKSEQSSPEPAKKHNKIEPAVDENTIAEEKPHKPYVAPIIADTFSHLANRFNEQIGENQGEDISYMHGKHSEKISEMIGVNDRYYYIREIFDGKRDAYNEAMIRMENANDFKKAKDILAEYKTERTSNEAVKQLLHLIRRKLGSHE